MEITGSLVTSSLWAKLFLSLVFLIYGFQTRRLVGDRSLQLMSLLALVLILRDLAVTLSGAYEILLLSDLIVLGIYSVWAYRAGGRSRGMLLSALLYLLLLPVLLLSSGPRFVSIVPEYTGRLLLLLPAALLTIQLYRITPSATGRYEMVLLLRAPLTFGLLLYNALLVGTGESSGLTHYILVPFSYLLHIGVLYAYNKVNRKEKDEMIETLARDIDDLFDFMRTLGSAISEHIEIDRVLEYIVNVVLANTRADGGAVLLIDEFDDNLRVKAVSGIFPPPYPVPDKVKAGQDHLNDYFFSTPIPMGETIFGDVLKSGKPAFIKDAAKDSRFSHWRHQDPQFISSLIVIPLIVSRRILGVISVVKCMPGSFFTTANFNNVRSFADYTSLSLDNLFTYMELLEKKELDREVGIAADIQHKLLPAKLPSLKNADISAYSIPAKGVSGDYFDIIELQHQRLALVMCDVAGKGIPASLVMIMIRSILHLIASAPRDAATIVSWINRGITGQIDIDHYATLSFLTFDPHTLKIQYCNAGHHPLLIYRRAEDRIETFDTDGLPLGIERGSLYTSRETELETGDIICLYTDGIIEAMNSNGDQYGYERIVDYLRAGADKSSRELSDGIRFDLESFVGKARQHDDQTFLVMKIV
jgi:phosphoserine phosphatase RsbU/P